MYLVDTSALIALLRGHDGPARQFLRGLEQSSTPWALPMVCLQEVLQGARDESEWERLRRALCSQRLVVPRDPLAHALESARIYYDCRRQGLTIRSSVDCQIAALALEQNAVLVHDDDDYRRIAQVRPLRIAPA